MNLKSGKLRVFLIGLMVFGCADICMADCAWVLWMKTDYYQIENEKLKHGIEWEMIIACPKFEQCLDSQRQAYQQKKQYWETNFKNIIQVIPEPFSKDSQILRIRLKNKKDNGFADLIFQCFPDTLDPRK